MRQYPLCSFLTFSWILILSFGNLYPTHLPRAYQHENLTCIPVWQTDDYVQGHPQNNLLRAYYYI
jgi:hypothetical protein